MHGGRFLRGWALLPIAAVDGLMEGLDGLAQEGGDRGTEGTGILDDGAKLSEDIPDKDQRPKEGGIGKGKVEGREVFEDGGGELVKDQGD